MLAVEAIWQVNGLKATVMETWKVCAARKPEEDFAALRKEALLLDQEYGDTQPEVACSSVNESHVCSSSLQGNHWREDLKREIMEDIK